MANWPKLLYVKPVKWENADLYIYVFQISLKTDRDDMPFVDAFKKIEANNYNPSLLGGRGRRTVVLWGQPEQIHKTLSKRKLNIKFLL
jgi:hypothetical protein